MVVEILETMRTVLTSVTAFSMWMLYLIGVMTPIVICTADGTSNLGFVLRFKRFGTRLFVVLIISLIPVINLIYSFFLMHQVRKRGNTLFDYIKTAETPEDMAILLDKLGIISGVNTARICDNCTARQGCSTKTKYRSQHESCIAEKFAGKHRELLPLLQTKLSQSELRPLIECDELPWGIYVKKIKDRKVIEEKFIQKKRGKNRDYYSKQDAEKDFKHLRKFYYLDDKSLSRSRQEQVVKYDQVIAIENSVEATGILNEKGMFEYFFSVTKEPRPGFYDKIRVAAEVKPKSPLKEDLKLIFIAYYKRIKSLFAKDSKKGGSHESNKNLNTRESIWKRCSKKFREFFGIRGE